ncbi:MAG: cobalamin B12-binding domain-containing protein [Deltaproteobacteria bacterium]|nr:cobalamin B12-binding domain-containing protein [Deltaproteobacteria bacterium]
MIKPKILLATFAGIPSSFSFFCPDPGLAALAAVLRKHFYELSILDFNSLQTIDECMSETKSSCVNEFVRQGVSKQKENVLAAQDDAKWAYLGAVEKYMHRCMREQVLAKNCDLLCVKPWLGHSLAIFLRICRALKTEFPKLKIAFGGPSISSIGSEILQHLHSADFVCMGDGEEAIVSIVRYLQGILSLDPITNTWFIDENKEYCGNGIHRNITISSAPDPLYDDQIDRSLIDGKLPMFVIEDSRGCFFSCPFCAHPGIGDKQVRPAEPERVFETMMSLSARFRTHAFRFSGSCPSPSFLNGLSKAVTKIGEKF